MARFRAFTQTFRFRLTLWFVLSLSFILILLSAFLYIQLRRSLLAQVDMALQLAAAQALVNIDADNGQLRFQNNESNAAAWRALSDDFVIYLVAPDGSKWDSFGSESEVPLLLPPAAGFTTLDNLEDPWRVFVQEIQIGETSGWLQIVQELEIVQRTLQSLLTQILWGLPLAILLAGIGGYILAARAINPVDRITRTAQAITGHDLSKRINYIGPDDEIGRLAATLDMMLDRLQSTFARERRFTSDAAHELRTPLAALKGRIGVTLSQPRQPQAYQETLQTLESQVDRLIRLSNDLLFMARLEQGEFQSQFEVIDLVDFMGAVVDQIRPLATAKAINLQEDIPPDLSIKGDMDLFIRLFLNLLDNAVKYTPRNGRVTINAHQENKNVIITIRDSGPGIAPQHLPHLFDRFYRVEGDRGRIWNDNRQSGAGLGLAIAYEITRSFEGDLTVQSELGHGTTFFVKLPA